MCDDARCYLLQSAPWQTYTCIGGENRKTKAIRRYAFGTERTISGSKRDSLGMMIHFAGFL